MYDNSRVPSYMNVSSRPCRLQYSRWSLDTSTNSSQSSHQSIAGLSSSFYAPQPPAPKPILTPTYVNYQSASTSVSGSDYQRPRSIIIGDSTPKHQSTFHVNDLRQRFESKPVVGIVKPMVHQRSYSEMNSSPHQNKLQKMPTNMTGSYYQNSSRSSLHSALPSPSASTSSVIYRTRPISSQGSSTHGPPPVAPRRYSSISNHNNNNNKCVSSHRSSRTTSTSSSIIGMNELSSRISSDDHEPLDDDTLIVDVKRLEMFYGSVGTLVKAARSIARLYITTTRQLANFQDWSCQQLGVPVWIYNTGANLKRTRQVKLLLAQHDSCFAVWSSLISDQAELRLPKENHITCWLPESNMLVVFKFDREDACRLFFRHYYEILQYERRMNLANPPPLPADSVQPEQEQKQPPQSTGNKEVPRRYSRLRNIASKPDKEQEQQQFELRRCRSLSKIRTVKKSDISGPINFEHVNHIGNGSAKQSRPLSGTVTLRSLHASMSHLPSLGSIADRFGKQNKKRASASFEPRTTAV